MLLPSQEWPQSLVQIYFLALYAIGLLNTDSGLDREIFSMATEMPPPPKDKRDSKWRVSTFSSTGRLIAFCYC